MAKGSPAYLRRKSRGNLGESVRSEGVSRDGGRESDRGMFVQPRVIPMESDVPRRLGSAPALGAAGSMVSRVRGLYAEVSRLDVRAFERSDSRELTRGLCPLVSHFLAQTSRLIAEIGASSEPEDAVVRESQGPEFELHIDSLIVSADSVVRLLADIAFVAGLELSQRSRQLSALDSTVEAAEILVQCDSALRRIKKSLVAVEHALASLEGSPGSARYHTELESSLRVRVRYARLRTAILGAGQPAADTLHARMRAAGTQIAMLIGNDIYPELRIRDRIQLRSLQDRILAWLRTKEPRDEVAGGRLWQDLDAFLRMLALVNKRQELRAHDASVLVAASLDLAAGSHVSDVSSRLASLRRLDDELDAMLDHATVIEASYWADVVGRLSSEVGRPSELSWSAQS